eukprot:SAG25_NODE_761_length_5514_cov_23.676822_6_plen_120_part_00
MSSLVKLLRADELDWAYSLRTLSMLGTPLAYDRCESLGELHPVWDWDGLPNFNAAHSQWHVDTVSAPATITRHNPAAALLSPRPRPLNLNQWALWALWTLAALALAAAAAATACVVSSA